MASPEDPGVLAWLADKAWAVIAALVGLAWRNNQQAHKDTRKLAADALQAHQLEDAKEFRALRDEQSMQRGHIGKLFDQMRDEVQRSEARHLELMSRMHAGHSELLRTLNSKADK